ncbi:SHOCT domain-containing protein [Microbacterium sp. Au-Mic1]|uniref:SHOCT domain-containing protein n=1 Tax=Microbacterium sp. Au-Mic1 TaxID=2906457 RepID=UPI001E3DA23B|nr:SHOCT domain-containing protein [Microbacterium sp. Au-Mic1]MCE4026216.1 SHOCT domain-containing protein [Microbacterium sp. Au-Mic1]
MRELKTAMKDSQLANLFPGLSFSEDSATYQGVTQPIAGATAVVDSAGALSRRPTLTRVAVGTVLAGAVGAIGGALLQKKEDGREVFILIDGTQAAWAVPVKPDELGDATRFTALFNTAAKQAAAAASEEPAADAPAHAPASVPAAAGSTIAEQLSQLSTLHAAGALSDDEFARAKAAALRNL